MTRVMWTKKIPFSLKAKDCITETNGFLSMTRSGSLYRATVRVQGEPDRTHGTVNERAYQTAKDLLCRRFPGRIEETERQRVLDVVEEVYGCLPDGSQPRKEPATPVATSHTCRTCRNLPQLLLGRDPFLVLSKHACFCSPLCLASGERANGTNLTSKMEAGRTGMQAPRTANGKNLTSKMEEVKTVGIKDMEEVKTVTGQSGASTGNSM